MTSVRESLDRVGQAVSIKQLAHQRNESFPLSLRQFVGALPPGRIYHQPLSSELLQRFFDGFFNNRAQPLFQVRIDGPNMGASKLTIAMYDTVKQGYDHENPFVSQDLAGPGEVLELPGVFFGTHRFRFQDLNSDGLTLNVIPGQLVGIQIVVHFETEGGIEIKVEDFNAHDIDFDSFNITLNFAFGVHNGLLDLVGFIDTFNPDDLNLDRLKQFINTYVSVDVDFLPDGVVANKVKNTINTKIFEALADSTTREKISRALMQQILGDAQVLVVDVQSGSDGIVISYMDLAGDQLEPFPETKQAPFIPINPAALANIDHIVVLMMENRSFDHMLGYLSKHGERADVDGLHGGEKNRFLGHDVLSFPLSSTLFPDGPDHDHDSVANQVNGGKMDGFVANFAERLKRPDHNFDDPTQVMGYYSKDQVPTYDALAREFGICQRWFSSHPGPTFCNRFYTLTGRLNRDSNGNFEFDNPHGANFKPVTTKTLFDHLTLHGVSWHYYEHGYCFLRMFRRYRLDNQYIVDARDPSIGFFASARSGTLPSVSFIDPDFIDVPPGNDDGPPADIQHGQHLIAKVVNALMDSPKWNKTLLVVTYDEHGGFYDHVPPPEAAAVSTEISNHYGVRVPVFIISPWVKRGNVDSTLFDHTSIAKTIACRFMSDDPPDMGERMAKANDLSAVLTSTMRTDKPNIPIPPEPDPSLARVGPEVEEDDTEFKAILRIMRSRDPVRR